MAAQVSQCLDNIEAVLAEADMTLANVVRLQIFTVDVDTFMSSSEALTQRFTDAGARYTSTLIGVARPAFPQFLVEIEATAVA